MAGLDKMWLEVAGRPLIAWTIDAIAAAPEVERIALVVAPDRAAAPRPSWLPATVVAIVAGGARRQDSVAAGIAALEDLTSPPGLDGSTARERVVLVHDGARPLVSPALVAAVARAAAAGGAAIPIVPIAETVKRVSGDRVVETVDRSDLAAAQTPQGVRWSVLRQAYAMHPPGGPLTFTDEAALLEACRIPIHSLPGDPVNLKVTLPGDVARVEAALQAARPSRVGFGRDSHPFGPGEPLRLGGIAIPGAPRLHGHSDGDVALHAIADGLLGAAGLPDLGRLAPADDRTPAGIASTDLLATVLARVAAEGWRPAGVDLTLTGARPRLADHLDAMRNTIAGLLSIDPGSVSVKGDSGNLQGPEGAGRAMTAEALVTLAGRGPEARR